MIKTLIGIRLRSLFYSLGKKNKKGESAASSGRIAAMLVLYGVLILLFAFFSLTVAVAMAPTMIAAGLDALYFSIYMLAAFTVVFLLSIFETKSELFECKDNALLLSMPIPPHAIVASRVITILLYNYAETAVVFFPAVAVYLAFGGTPLAALGAALVFLLLPLLATALASAVGYLVARIAGRLKNNSLVTLVLSLSFLALYFFGYSRLTDGIDAFLEEIAAGGIVSGAPFLVFLGGAALLSPLPLLAFAAVSLGGSALAYFLISRCYFRLITGTAHTARVVYRERTARQGSAFTAVVKKELHRYISSSTYMLNSGLGLIFQLGVAVYALFGIGSLRALLAEALSAAAVSDLLAVGAVLVPTFFSLCTFISCCTLSLEGSAFPLLRTLPIPARTILLAKATPHILITLPFSLLSALLLAIATQAPWYYCLFLFLMPTAANLFSALFGMVMNVAFPKFDYVTEAQVIKQSTAIFVCTFGQMFFALLLTAFTVLLSLAAFGVLACALVTLLLLLLSLCMLLLLIGPCSKRYETL